MNTRSLGRELAYLAIGQITNKTELTTESMITACTRALKKYARNNITSIQSDLKKLGDYFFMQEQDSEESGSIPVAVPVNMSELVEHVEKLEVATHNILDAINIPDLVNHNQEAYRFAVSLINLYRDHKDTIQELLEKTLESKHSTSEGKGWSSERILSTDRTAIKLGITELLYNRAAPVPVIIDEVITIAGKYGIGDSPKFVNGILADIAKEHRG